MCQGGGGPAEDRLHPQAAIKQQKVVTMSGPAGAAAAG